KYEKKIAEEVYKREAPTYIQGGKPPGANLEGRSYFDVYEFDLGRSEDEPPLIIVGNDAQIALQASLLRAVDQLLAERGFGAFNFRKWADQFEEGFPSLTVGVSAELKKMRSGKDKNPWPNVAYGNRPKIVEISVHGNTKDKPDYKTVQFIPDRESPNDWHIFTGSYREIAAQIINWWNQKSKEKDAAAAPKGGVTSFKGTPQIIFMFRGVNDKKEAVNAEISLRLIKHTDNPKRTNLDLITTTDIKNYAKKIKEIFCSNNTPYIIKKGKEVVSYKNRDIGFDGSWYAVRSKDIGVELIKKLLAIIGEKFDQKYCFHSQNLDPSKRFPTETETITVLEEKHQLDQERPIADVAFKYANIYLPTTRKKIRLVTGATINYV
ncbi:MAG TPA: hypothetical protein VK211_24545, partial [Kamptonema sp.]|nr:hypothetical protein [Kamptonema sp.]